VAVGHPVRVPQCAGTIAVCVCTHRRNRELNRLLESLVPAIASYAGAVTVVVNDDNDDGRARSVVEDVEARHPELTIVYTRSAAGNIAVARQTAVDAALATDPDWLAFVDDDEVVTPTWLTALTAVAAEHGCTAVTGPVHMTYPDAPRWLTDAPFGTLGIGLGEEGERSATCSTGNSLVAADFFLRNPQLRFDARYGVTGGEDMMFFRTAVALGLDVRFSHRVAIRQIMPAERSTLRYQIRAAWWLGTSGAANDLAMGAAPRWRLVARAVRSGLRHLARPARRAAALRPPQWRYALAGVAHAMGALMGATGYRALHR
jgi:succinoglycan biosynthesis protein ExoM